MAPCPQPCVSSSHALGQLVPCLSCAHAAPCSGGFQTLGCGVARTYAAKVRGPPTLKATSLESGSAAHQKPRQRSPCRDHVASTLFGQPHQQPLSASPASSCSPFSHSKKCYQPFKLPRCLPLCPCSAGASLPQLVVSWHHQLIV